MRLVTLYVPGLASRHVDGGALASLRAHAPRQRAALVPSFPFLTASVRASVAAGAPPSHHGVRFEEDGPLPDSRDLLRLAAESSGLELRSTTIESGAELGPRVEAGDGVLRLEFGGLAAARRCEGAGSIAEQEALVALEEVIGGILRVNTTGVLIHGSAALLPVGSRLDAGELLAGGGCRVQAEGGVAWVEGSAGNPPAAWRDRVLDREGVARILCGRALELHQAPADRGWAVVCERGWSFDDAHSRATAVEADHPEAPVVLGWGDEDAVWPPAIHDHRLGPTLAGALGHPPENPFDRPLPF